jgi:hypothetical protein
MLSESDEVRDRNGAVVSSAYVGVVFTEVYLCKFICLQ